MITKIKSIHENPSVFADQKITVTGWVRSNRVSKKLGFLVINDGSDFSNIQVVYKANNLANFDEIKDARMWAAVQVVGELKLTPSKQQSFELDAQEIILLKQSDEDFLMNNNDLSLETLRTNAHLRIRTNTFHAIMKIRSTLAFSIHQFMNQNDFNWVAAPLFTGNDAEGAGETFVLKTNDNEEFFGKPTFLTVTGQLQAEAYAQALTNVYTFGPTFRAEKSHTNRHLAEFWMVEPEMAFADLSQMQVLIEQLVKYCIQQVLERNHKELSFLADKNDPDLIKRLRNVVQSDFIRLDYKTAIDILQKAQNDGYVFENKDIFFGMDLNSEHERYLCEKYVYGPVFLQNYPKEIKAFYMKLNDDEKTVAATDLLIPAIGELVGGSQREADYDKLLQRCHELKLDVPNLQWYLDLRRYGYYMSSGFGIGFERLVMYVTGVDNIKDSIPFPRSHGQINF
ncbi:asparagine--tRNA ligase [Ureaplasma miroungigenitalium]|uniref:asparagine--tRNA ligase n=1 Tax=Ureaplasma miroungigenitalium TaxID=1042321 RepID=UPI0021E81152|nr:asparagine--tRNA ligase [Ureaplasma miroungigenitalium]MCV3734512.1 asparagine--tRNA ligase [Ureaplasma miroungigenitalium]